MGCCGCKKTVQTYNIKTINTKLISKKFDNIDKNIIDLDLNNKITEISDFSALCELDLPYLEKLNLSNNNLYDISGLETLKVPNLKTLDLSQNKLSNTSGLQFLNVPCLENLNLSNNNISDISELKLFKVPNLKILDLSYNNIKTFDVFLELDFTLEELNLIGNEITQIGIFEQAKCLQNLKKLRFDINDKEYESNINIISDLIKSIKDLDFEQKHKKTNINRLETLHLINSTEKFKY